MSHIQRYATSMLCNLFFANELARRLSAATDGVTRNAFDPDAVPATGLLRGQGRLLRAIVAGPWIKDLGVRVETAQSAGRTLARLGTDPGFATKTRVYFAGPADRASSRDSYCRARAQESWSESLCLVGLSQ